MPAQPSHTVDVEGRRQLDAELHATWRELHNPDALAYSIRRCERVEQRAPDCYRAHFRIGVGPLKVPVGADLSVVAEDPPYRYRLCCTLSMKMLGDAEGEARIQLAEADGGVLLAYRASVGVRGRIAGYGIDFVRGAVVRNIDHFFDRFSAWMDDQGERTQP